MNFNHEAAKDGFILAPLAILFLGILINAPADFIALVGFIVTVALICAGGYYIAGFIGGLLQ